MVYNNDMVQRAMRLARGAYAGKIDSRGKLCYLDAFKDCAPDSSEREMVVHLLSRALRETPLSLDNVRAANFDEDVIQAVAPAAYYKNRYSTCA